MTKRRLTFPGYLDSLNEEIPPPETIEPTDPTEVEWWRKHVFVGTRLLGVFETENFVLENTSPLGVPTWTAINTGLPVGVWDLLDLTADPFNPEERQYALFEDGVYRRESGGNWVQVLTHAVARAFIAATGGTFAQDGISCNINHDGYIACLYNGTGIPGLNPWATAYLVSTDYGTTWALKGYVDGPTALGTTYISLQVGAYQGTSIYGAGQVIYAHGLVGAANRIAVSLDAGATWNRYAYGFGVGICESDCLVDPNDQGRVFISSGNVALPPPLIVSEDHGVTWTQYDLNATQLLGSRSPWHHISVAMNEARTVRAGSRGVPVDGVNRTDDDGTTWQEPTAQWSDDDLGISMVQDSPFFLYLMRQSSSGNAATDWHVIWASEDEGVTMIPKSGANCSIGATGGGDSIPWDNGGIRGIVEIWTDRDSVPGTPWTEPPIGRLPGPVPEHTHDIEDHDHTSAAGDGGILTNDEHDGYLELAEIAIPGVPGANLARFYAKDNAGVPDPYWRRDDGSEVNLAAGGAGGNLDAWRADRTVDPLGGGTDLTLQAAVTALGVGGGGIFVMPGSYNETITLPAGVSDLEIRGAGMDQVTVWRAAGGQVLASLGACTDVTIRDLTLENTSSALNDDCAYFHAGGANNRVKFNRVRFKNGYRGLYLRGTSATECRVENCRFDDTQGNTSLYINAGRSFVLNNLINDPVGYGIEWAGGDHTIIKGNWVYSSGDDGINVNAARGQVTENRIEAAGDYGIFLGASSAEVVVGNNVVDGSVDCCIMNQGGNYNSFVDNQLYNGSSHGLRIHGGNTHIIKGNLIYTCGGDGLYFSNGTDRVVISGNAIYDNTGDGIFVESASGSIDFAVNGNLIMNNGQWGVDLGSAVNQQYWIFMGNDIRLNTSGQFTNHTHATNIWESDVLEQWNLPYSTPERVFDAYDSVGGTALANPAYTTVPMATERIKDAIFVHAGTGIVTVNYTGLYRVSYHATGYTTYTGAARQNGEWRLNVIGAGVAGTNVYTYHRIASDSEQSAGGVALLSLTSGDTVRLEGREYRAGDIVLCLINGSSLTIELIR